MISFSSRALVLLAFGVAGCGGAIEHSPSGTGETPGDGEGAGSPDAATVLVPNGASPGASASTPPPRQIAAGKGNVGDIACDGTSLYWTDTGPDIFSSDGSVTRSALDGSNVTVLAASQSGPLDLAVDSTSVYWTNLGDQGAVPGSVMKVSKAGGGPVALASGGAPYAIVADATSVYWTDLDAGTISKVGIDGSELTTLVSGQQFPIYGKGLAADSAHLYWVTATGAIMKVGLDGGALTTLASGRSGPQGIAVDETNVYWGEGQCANQQCSGAVMKMALDGSAVTTIASNQADPEYVGVNSGDVYWATQNGNFAKSDGQTVTLLYASGFAAAGAFTFGGGEAYWVLLGNPGAIVEGLP